MQQSLLRSSRHTMSTHFSLNAFLSTVCPLYSLEKLIHLFTRGVWLTVTFTRFQMNLVFRTEYSRFYCLVLNYTYFEFIYASNFSWYIGGRKFNFTRIVQALKYRLLLWISESLGFCNPYQFPFTIVIWK